MELGEVVYDSEPFAHGERMRCSLSRKIGSTFPASYSALPEQQANPGLQANLIMFSRGRQSYVYVNTAAASRTGPALFKRYAIPERKVFYKHRAKSSLI